MDSFTTHCFIEFYYRTEKGFLNEHNSKLMFFKLNESYGVFDGCRTLAEQVADRLISEEVEEGEARIVTIQLNNKWINRIEAKLYINGGTNEMAAYMPGESKILICGNGKDKVKKFYPLRLNVNMYNPSKKTLVLRLMHELTHAYEDYNRQVKGARSLESTAIWNGDYLNTMDYEGIKQCVSYVFYYFRCYERNAYIAQMKGELETSEEHFSNIGEIINFIKNTTTYKNYSTLCKYVDNFAKIKDENTRKQILGYTREISNFRFNTYEQFMKYMEKTKRDIERKFNTIIPKMAYETLSFGNHLAQHEGEVPQWRI